MTGVGLRVVRQAGAAGVVRVGAVTATVRVVTATVVTALVMVTGGDGDRS